MIFHIPRALAGFYLVYKLPKSHEIIEGLDLNDVHDSEHSVDTFYSKAKFSLKVQLIYAGDECKKWLLIYSGATAICYLFDCINFVLAYKNIASLDGNQHTELLMLLASTLNLFLDLYYLMWVMSLSRKLPVSISSLLQDALFGYTNKLRRGFMDTMNPHEKDSVQTVLDKMKKEQELKTAQLLKEKKEKAEAAKAAKDAGHSVAKDKKANLAVAKK